MNVKGYLRQNPLVELAKERGTKLEAYQETFNKLKSGDLSCVADRDMNDLFRIVLSRITFKVHSDLGPKASLDNLRHQIGIRLAPDDLEVINWLVYVLAEAINLRIEQDPLTKGVFFLNISQYYVYGEDPTFLNVEEECLLFLELLYQIGLVEDPRFANLIQECMHFILVSLRLDSFDALAGWYDLNCLKSGVYANFYHKLPALVLPESNSFTQLFKARVSQDKQIRRKRMLSSRAISYKLNRSDSFQEQQPASHEEILAKYDNNFTEIFTNYLASMTFHHLDKDFAADFIINFYASFVKNSYLLDVGVTFSSFLTTNLSEWLKDSLNEHYYTFKNRLVRNIEKLQNREGEMSKEELMVLWPLTLFDKNLTALIRRAFEKHSKDSYFAVLYSIHKVAEAYLTKSDGEAKSLSIPYSAIGDENATKLLKSLHLPSPQQMNYFYLPSLNSYNSVREAVYFLTSNEENITSQPNWPDLRESLRQALMYKNLQGLRAAQKKVNKLLREIEFSRKSSAHDQSIGHIPLESDEREMRELGDGVYQVATIIAMGKNWRNFQDLGMFFTFPQGNKDYYDLFTGKPDREVMTVESEEHLVRRLANIELNRGGNSILLRMEEPLQLGRRSLLDNATSQYCYEEQQDKKSFVYFQKVDNSSVNVLNTAKQYDGRLRPVSIGVASKFLAIESRDPKQLRIKSGIEKMLELREELEKKLPDEKVLEIYKSIAGLTRMIVGTSHLYHKDFSADIVFDSTKKNLDIYQIITGESFKGNCTVSSRLVIMLLDMLGIDAIEITGIDPYIFGDGVFYRGEGHAKNMVFIPSLKYALVIDATAFQRDEAPEARSLPKVGVRGFEKRMPMGLIHGHTVWQELLHPENILAIGVTVVVELLLLRLVLGYLGIEYLGNDPQKIQQDVANMNSALNALAAQENGAAMLGAYALTSALMILPIYLSIIKRFGSQSKELELLFSAETINEQFALTLCLAPHILEVAHPDELNGRIREALEVASHPYFHECVNIVDSIFSEQRHVIDSGQHFAKVDLMHALENMLREEEQDPIKCEIIMIIANWYLDLDAAEEENRRKSEIYVYLREQFKDIPYSDPFYGKGSKFIGIFNKARKALEKEWVSSLRRGNFEVTVNNL